LTPDQLRFCLRHKGSRRHRDRRQAERT
jgi:hypothetical protein